MSNKVDFAAKRARVTVEVPEVGESFTLRSLSMSFMNTLKTGDDDAGLKQLSQAIIDDVTGLPMYNVEELREMSLGTYGVLMRKLNELHGVTKEATEEAEKKLAASQNTVSASA